MAHDARLSPTPQEPSAAGIASANPRDSLGMKYVVPSSAQINGNTIQFEKAHRRTDLITAQLSFTIGF